MTGHRRRRSARSALAVGILGLFGSSCGAADAAVRIEGQVQIGGGAVAGSTVGLWAASANAPSRLAQVTTDAEGRFVVSVDAAPNGASSLYLIASGGAPAVAKPGGDSKGLELLAVLGSDPPPRVVINELTTVASAFTNARFLDGESISGNPLGLKIAAGNVPNLVDLATGGWGKALLDPINSTQTTTLATFDTLGSLITAYAVLGDADWRGRLFKAATPTAGPQPKNTLEAMVGVARESWADPKGLFGLFAEAYPQPADGARRAAPFLPYLLYAPDDFSLMLAFAGGGMYANGRFMFDADGNLWSGQNWMPGSQSGAVNSIGGGVLEMAPNGKPLSPPITGFTGMGLDGVGWGTAVTRDKVWVTSFNGKLLVMDFDGKPVATEQDLPFKQKLRGLMGIGVADNGDVWIADGSDDQLLFFPEGRIKDGRIVKVAGLRSPFDIVIDPQNRVWVSNAQSDTIVRFPADDPTKTETFRAGISVRALAMDSKANVWVTSNMSPDFPIPRMPDHASIMTQFEILGKALLTYPKPTGVVNLILPDGTQVAPKGFDGGGAIDVPWGVNIDGNDDVWVGNLGPYPLGRSVVLMAGVDTQGHKPGTRPGDVLHVFKGGSIQMLTDVAIDPAGDVWAANNWNDPVAATSDNPNRATSTWGGGSGLTVIYGVAAPVKPPRIGVTRGF
ncbi:hypothetical protein DFR50_12619 [Roseiarcus fermentans]|uniref:NHL repeat-containing protein n=1 Tax=Roseiarcus fermentans TaxID=1473586 RepID=A0A366F0P7_9HYPH|nr:hypothetical protein [Roseiarcus fermentans]RBP08174.1 hypothetical protein DFR50_12619 [Roseiarcus fermentans]